MEAYHGANHLNKHIAILAAQQFDRNCDQAVDGPLRARKPQSLKEKLTDCSYDIIDFFPEIEPGLNKLGWPASVRAAGTRSPLGERDTTPQTNVLVDEYRAQPRCSWRTSGLSVLKYSSYQEFPDSVLRLILSGIRGDSDSRILIGGYIIGVCKDMARGQPEDAWQAINPERREFLMGTILEELLAERKAEAKAVGRAEGRVEGKAELFIQMLHRRFGPLPENVEARIRASAALNVDAWIDTVLEAKSVDEVVAAAGSR